MVEIKRSEQGQALVLIVLGIVVLLGFAALAIDGGRVFSDRRNMQNAADTAALTAAANYAMYFDANNIWHKNWSCFDGWYNSATASAKTAAINRAQSNGYTIDAEAQSDNNGVETYCFEINRGGFTEKFIDIETYITATTPSSFAQFVFNGPLVQTVRSTARIRPQSSLGFGNAIVALNPAICDGNNNGVQLDGGFDVQINGGGIISMGCLGTGGSGDVVVTDGTMVYHTGWVNTGPGAVIPDPAAGSDALPEQVVEIPPPDCSGLPNWGQDLDGGTLEPGYYSRIRVNANQSATLQPGLYCMTGNFEVAGQGAVYGNGVTIYLINGDFDTQGGSEVSLSAPMPPPDPSPALTGVLIYMDKDNAGEVNLLGSSSSWYQGTVFVPSGEIEVGGSGSDLPTYSTQLIGWDVFVHGNATIDINFQEALVYQVPPNLDLQK